MRRFGVRNLAAAARTVFPASKTIRHLAINRADACVLHRHFHHRAAWLPNLTERAKPPAQSRVRRAARLAAVPPGRERRAGLDPSLSVVAPQKRRRSAPARAVVAPQGWLVTTGGFSSRDEQAYFDKLNAAGAPAPLATATGGARG